MADLGSMPLPDAPFPLLGDWLEAAPPSGLDERFIVTLATATAGAAPSMRMVLARDVGPGGAVFFTNYDSRKGLHLAENPQAALLFWWPESWRQVRIEGHVSKASPEVSDAYFASRQRKSQIGAWASLQSRELDTRATLERRVEEFDARFKEQDVPRPPNWGGYLLSPARVEFFEPGESRLHTRVQYERDTDGAWTHRLLYP